MDKKLSRILLTPGEPAGIGPDIVVNIAQLSFAAELIVIADPDLLMERAHQLNLPLALNTYQQNNTSPHQPGRLKIIPVPLNEPVTPGKLSKANADYVIKTLTKAAMLCAQKDANAIVTGPVHKAIINEAGISFIGHTEFFAQLCNVKKTVMLFVMDQLKVALVTTHLPLKEVAANITKENLQNTIRILDESLRQQFGIENPCIYICGLNPHAGENGHLGREELDIIAPALKALEEEVRLVGPLPADTIFTAQHLKQADAILAMYHDQALPVVKYAGFDRAVNVTLGLPYVRTSVDHGTALDIAGSGKANPGSLAAAIHLAISLS